MRSKDIGTDAETRVVKFLRENGFPHAERRALHGNKDLGDISGTIGLVWEVKAGEAARTASDKQILDWLDETEVERENAHASYGFLITARYRKGVKDWWAHMTAADFRNLMIGDTPGLVFPVAWQEPMPFVPVRMPLSGLLDILEEKRWTDSRSSRQPK